MSDERPDGFYWVKVDKNLPWEPAHIRSGRWTILGSECDFYDPFEIGPYISAEPQDNGWRDIASAPKDGTPILAYFRADLVEFTGRDDLDRWADKAAVLEYVGHIGITANKIALNWAIRASDGLELFRDAWIDGWMPVPAPPQMKEKGE